MIVVNGRERPLAEDTVVADVVAEVAGDYQRRGLAVAVNGEVVPRSAWHERRLVDGDRVEVLTATQGG